MLRSALLALALFAGPLLAQPEGLSPGLTGRVEDRTYVSPTGIFRVAIPVLPELGGTITDTPNVVTFQDNYNVHVSIGVFAQDASQRWELSTRGLKDYLVYFFTNYVLPDFRQMYPGGKLESATFAPSVLDGALITYTLLPGGSMFGDKRIIRGADDPAPVAKRGNLVFVRNGYIFVISTELAERVTEGRAYQKTTAEEDAILRQRLVDLVGKMEFTKPAAGT